MSLLLFSCLLAVLTSCRYFFLPSQHAWCPSWRCHLKKKVDFLRLISNSLWDCRAGQKPFQSVSFWWTVKVEEVIVSASVRLICVPRVNQARKLYSKIMSLLFVLFVQEIGLQVIHYYGAQLSVWFEWGSTSSTFLFQLQALVQLFWPDTMKTSIF